MTEIEIEIETKTETPSFLALADRTLAYQQTVLSKRKTSGPDLFFLSGFASDMMGSKAVFLAEKAPSEDVVLTRFDYQGHGQSSGSFREGSIGLWVEDACAILDRCTTGPQILIGSSMGGWIAMRLMQLRPDRIAGFIGLAPAPDFTEDLILPFLSPEDKKALEEDGAFFEKTVPPEIPLESRRPITAKLLQEAKNQLVLRSPLAFSGPVVLIQGQQDRDVPWEHVLKIAETIQSPDIQTILLKDASHRLSRPQDLTLLWRVVQDMREKLNPS